MNIRTITDNWSWIGLDAVEIVDANAFGNVVVRDSQARYWRICPEELSCQVVAGTPAEWTALRSSDDFREDWNMNALVQMAIHKFGTLPPDQCYCLKMPAVLGGKYELTNLGTISREELVSFAGHVANQIKDLPDGARIEFILNWTTA